MNADAIIYDPIVATPVTNQNLGIVGGLGGKYTVHIHRDQPLGPYTYAAEYVMDHACEKHYPMLLDVRKNPIPNALNLIDLVTRFHNGETRFWVARPEFLSPLEMEFAGEFGVFLFVTTPHHAHNTSMWWYWIDTTKGQLLAVDYGLLCVKPATRWYCCFATPEDARSYYELQKP